MTPGLVLRDPDIIKDVLIKDQNSFRRNDFNMSEKVDPVLATNPFFCVDDEWRHSRKTIAPAFSPNRVNYASSQSSFNSYSFPFEIIQVKMVYPLMETCAQKMVDFVKYYKSNEDIEARAVSRNNQSILKKGA